MLLPGRWGCLRLGIDDTNWGEGVLYDTVTECIIMLV